MVIVRLCYEAYQIDYKSNKHSDSRRVWSIAQKYIREHALVAVLSKMLSGFGKKIYAKLYEKCRRMDYKNRSLALASFRDKCIRHTPSVDDYTINHLCNDFDIYVCGSDQIWKPTVVNNAYMLGFAPEDKPCLSYAASLSVDYLNDDD